MKLVKAEEKFKKEHQKIKKYLYSLEKKDVDIYLKRNKVFPLYIKFLDTSKIDKELCNYR